MYVLQMKRDAEANKEPPVYTGKWAKASQEEVDEMLAKGAKPAYRFRVPKDKTITVPDAVRGDVSWNTDTLGDFIILRSDGSPVYNFCVAVDDALMKISHVIRAEEHLPNTLRQVLLVYVRIKIAHIVCPCHLRRRASAQHTMRGLGCRHVLQEQTKAPKQCVFFHEKFKCALCGGTIVEHSLPGHNCC